MFTTNDIKKILITGGAGYIGNSIIQALPESIEVVIIDNFTIDTEYKRRANDALAKNRKLTRITANTAEVEKYSQVLADVDLVIYMASLNSYKESNRDPLLYLRENDLSLQTFLQALKQFAPQVKKMILTSTRGVYGEGPYVCQACHARMFPNSADELACTVCSSKQIVPQPINESDLVNPNSYYGVTKKLQEDMIRLYTAEKKIPLDIFRIFNVYGEDQGKYYSNIGVIPQMFAQIINKQEIYVSGDGSLARDFVYIGDIVKIFLESIFAKNQRKNNPEIYNLGSGQPVSINNLADYFEKLGYQFNRRSIPASDDIKYSVADNKKALETFSLGKWTDVYDFLNQSYGKVK